MVDKIKDYQNENLSTRKDILLCSDASCQVLECSKCKNPKGKKWKSVSALTDFLMTTITIFQQLLDRGLSDAFYSISRQWVETSFSTNKFWQNVGAKTSKKNRCRRMWSMHKGHSERFNWFILRQILVSFTCLSEESCQVRNISTLQHEKNKFKPLVWATNYFVKGVCVTLIQKLVLRVKLYWMNFFCNFSNMILQ